MLQKGVEANPVVGLWEREGLGALNFQVFEVELAASEVEYVAIAGETKAQFGC